METKNLKDYCRCGCEWIQHLTDTNEEGACTICNCEEFKSKTLPENWIQTDTLINSVLFKAAFIKFKEFNPQFKRYDIETLYEKKLFWKYMPVILNIMAWLAKEVARKGNIRGVDNYVSETDNTTTEE